MRYKGIRTDTKPWYKHFWPWFIIGIIVWTFMSGAGMLYFAGKDPYSMVDGFSKIGKVITEDKSKRQKAVRLGIKGLMNREDERFTLLLTPAEHAKDYQNLKLILIHPTMKKMDKTVSFQLVDGRLMTEKFPGFPDRTQIKITNELAGWTIAGSLKPGLANEVLLK